MERAKYTSLLDCLMPEPPVVVEGTFLLLEVLQWMAFPFVAAIPWTSPLQCVFFVTHVPLWDETGTCLPYNDMVLMIVQLSAVALVFITSFFALIAHLHPPKDDEYWALAMKLVSWALHLLARPLFLPLLRIMLEAGWRRMWVEGMLGFLGAVLLVMWSLMYVIRNDVVLLFPAPAQAL